MLFQNGSTLKGRSNSFLLKVGPLLKRAKMKITDLLSLTVDAFTLGKSNSETTNGNCEIYVEFN